MQKNIMRMKNLFMAMADIINARISSHKFKMKNNYIYILTFLMMYNYSGLVDLKVINDYNFYFLNENN